MRASTTDPFAAAPVASFELPPPLPTTKPISSSSLSTAALTPPPTLPAKKSKRRASLIGMMRGVGKAKVEEKKNAGGAASKQGSPTSARSPRKRRASIVGFMKKLASKSAPAAAEAGSEAVEGGGESPTARAGGRRKSLVEVMATLRKEIKDQTAEDLAHEALVQVAAEAAEGGSASDRPIAMPPPRTNRRRRNSLIKAASFIHKHHKKNLVRMKSLVKTTVDDDDDDDDDDDGPMPDVGRVEVDGDVGGALRGAKMSEGRSVAPDLDGAALQALLNPVKSSSAAELAELASANVLWEEANADLEAQVMELETANREWEDHAASLEAEADLVDQQRSAERAEMQVKLDAALLHTAGLEERLKEAEENEAASAAAAASGGGEAELVLKLEAKLRKASEKMEAKKKDVINLKAGHKLKLRAQVSQVKVLKRKLESADAKAEEISADAHALKSKVAALEGSLKAERARASELEVVAERNAAEASEAKEKLHAAMPGLATDGVVGDGDREEAAGEADDEAPFTIISGVMTTTGRYGPDDDEGDKHNQDAFVCIDAFDDRRAQWLFAVFDGHGSNGHDVAQWVRDAMPVDLLAHAALRSNPSGALFDCHAAMQKRLKTALGTKKCSLSGTTATVAIVRGRKLIVASVGDSCAYLGRVTKTGGTVHIEAIRLSVDHKPDE